MSLITYMSLVKTVNNIINYHFIILNETTKIYVELTLFQIELEDLSIGVILHTAINLSFCMQPTFFFLSLFLPYYNIAPIFSASSFNS